MKTIDEMKYSVSINQIELAYVDGLMQVYEALTDDYKSMRYEYDDETLIEVRDQNTGKLVYAGPLGTLRVADNG